MKKIKDLGTLVSLLFAAACAPFDTPITTTINPTNTYRIISYNEETGDSVFISEKVVNTAGMLYTTHDLELPMCLRGIVIGHRYFVNDIYIPFITNSSPSHATFNMESCHRLPDYIGPAHNHIGVQECGFSATDIVGFLNDAKAQIAVVFCNVDFRTQEGDYGAITKTMLERGN